MSAKGGELEHRTWSSCFDFFTFCRNLKVDEGGEGGELVAKLGFANTLHD